MRKSTRQMLAVPLSALMSVGLVSGAEAKWSVHGGLDVSYTDNVFQFGAAVEQEFLDDPTLPSADDSRDQEDVIWTPSMDIRWTPEGAPLMPEVAVEVMGFIYTENPVFNHGDFRVQVRTPLSRSAWAKVRYHTEPDVFLQQTLEEHDGKQELVEERVTSHIGSLELGWRPADQWTLFLESRYGQRFFNDPFDHRDLELWTVGPEIEWRPVPDVSLALVYLFERGVADGRGDPRINDDTSYRAHIAEVIGTIPLVTDWSVTASYIFVAEDFTSSLPGDEKHFGRVDLAHQGHGRLRYQWNTQTAWLLDVRLTRRNSNFDEFSFQSTILTLGVNYHW